VSSDEKLKRLRVPKIIECVQYRGIKEGRGRNWGGRSIEMRLGKQGKVKKKTAKEKDKSLFSTLKPPLAGEEGKEMMERKNGGTMIGAQAVQCDCRRPDPRTKT